MVKITKPNAHPGQPTRPPIATKPEPGQKPVPKPAAPKPA
jgi:hypothetical protein